MSQYPPPGTAPPRRPIPQPQMQGGMPAAPGARGVPPQAGYPAGGYPAGGYPAGGYPAGGARPAPMPAGSYGGYGGAPPRPPSAGPPAPQQLGPPQQIPPRAVSAGAPPTMAVRPVGPPFRPGVMPQGAPVPPAGGSAGGPPRAAAGAPARPPSTGAPMLSGPPRPPASYAPAPAAGGPPAQMRVPPPLGPAGGPPAAGPPAAGPPAAGPPAAGPPAAGPPALGPPAAGPPAVGPPAVGPPVGVRGPNPPQLAPPRVTPGPAPGAFAPPSPTVISPTNSKRRAYPPNASVEYLSGGSQGSMAIPQSHQQMHPQVAQQLHPQIPQQAHPQMPQQQMYPQAPPQHQHQPQHHQPMFNTGELGFANAPMAPAVTRLQKEAAGPVAMSKSGSVSNLQQPTTLQGYPSMPQLNGLDNSASSGDMLNAGMVHMVGQFSALTLGNQPPPSTALLQAPPDVSVLARTPRGPWLDPTSTAARSPLANAAAEFKRCTLNCIPNTQALLNKCRLPLGLIVTPYRLQALSEEPVPLVNPEEIVRCRKCRTYINPFVVFVDNGMRWKCNICFLTNDLPASYDYDLVTKAPVNRFERPELTHAVIEMVASSDYMVRPPQPVIMVFVLDVSAHAVQSGALRVACQVLADALDELPSSAGRTQVALMGVDRCLHFFSMPPNALEAQHFVVPDLTEPYLPSPTDLLVHLVEQREALRSWLGRLPALFADSSCADNALGPALLSACRLIASIGGKVIVVQASLPSLGPGALKLRDTGVGGAAATGAVAADLLRPADKFYKDLTVECSRNQIGLDLFVLSHGYADIATLAAGPKYTGGSLFFYPSFDGSSPEDCEKFGQEFTHFLASPLGLEAVLRIRATQGIRITGYHGNFFLRSTDLLALAHVTADNAYAAEFAIQDTLSSNIAIFQTALLHTSSVGERRIRVVTLAVPVTNNLADCFASADAEAITALLAKKAVERALTASVEDARDALVNKLVEILGAFRTAFVTSQQAHGLLVPRNLALLPLMLLGLLKSMAFRPRLAASALAGLPSAAPPLQNVLAAGQHHCCPSDWRSYLLATLYACPVEMISAFVHPRLYQIDTLDPGVGEPVDEGGEILLPPLLNLNSERLVSTGLFLLDNGIDLYLYAGRSLAPALYRSVFGVRDWESLATGKSVLLNQEPENDTFLRISNLVAQIRTTRLRVFSQLPYLIICKEDMADTALKMRFLNNLVEDRNLDLSSYYQFLTSLRDQLGR